MASSGPSKKRPNAAPKDRNQAPAALSSFFAPKKKAKKDDATSGTSKASKPPTGENQEKASSPPVKVFVDLDGVLVDFDKGVEDLTGRPPRALAPGILWSSIAKADHFYRHLPWMPDGEELWEAIRVLRPSILTGVPHSHSEQAARDKHAWCKRELCVETVHWSRAGPRHAHAAISKRDARSNTQACWCKVVTCWSRNKHRESGPGRVLIDDRPSLRAAWEEAGGIFVHHVSTKETLRALREMDLLPPPLPVEETNAKKAASAAAADAGQEQPISPPATEDDTEQTLDSTGEDNGASTIAAEKDAPKITQAEAGSSELRSSAEADDRAFSEKQVLESKEVPAVASN